MKKLIFILILIVFVYIPSIGQIDWIGNIHINKHFFNSDTDTISLSIDIQKEGITDFDVYNPNLKCKVELKSSSYRLENQNIQDIIELDLHFSKSENNIHRYKIKFPSKIMNTGRYSIEFSCTYDNWNTSFTSKEFNLKPEPITIGQFGFVQAISSLNINDEISKHAFIDFDNNFNLLPSTIGGVYPTGFCNDELVDFKDFKFHIWKDKSLPNNLKLSCYYSLDDNEKVELNTFNIDDDSFDGILNFDNKSFNYSFYSNENIVDYSISLTQDINDIIKKLILKGDSIHNINFYFYLEVNEDVERFPITDDIKTNFIISNAPQGADCQAALLPIDLLEWNVIKVGKIAHIEWTTVSEVNNDFFEIQKSIDARNWNVLTKIEGSGNSNEYNKYNYVDEFPYLGNNYYRLRQTDFDGDFKYSKVKFIFIYDNKLMLYPNPTTDYINFTILDPNNKFKVEIFSDSGQLIKVSTIPNKANNDNRIDIRSFDNGTYFIKYLNLQNHQVKITTFMKM